MTVLAVIVLQSGLHATNQFGDNISEIEFNGNKKVSDQSTDSRSFISSDSFCVTTFEGSFVINFIGGLDSATSVEFIIKNLTVLQALGLASVEQKDVLNYVRNYGYFEMFDTTGNATDDTLNVHYNLDFDLQDPPNGSSFQSVVGYASAITVKDEAGNTFLDENGFASLDTNGVSSQQPIFGGSYIAEGQSTDEGNGRFSNELEETYQPVVPLEETLELFSETFGQVFLQGFDAAESGIWEVNSANTLIITLTATNPNVRFRRFQKDVEIQPDTIINNKGQNFITKRPSPRQTQRAVVGRKKKFRWDVENNGPDINLDAGVRSILAKGPRNSSRLKFKYRSNGANVTAAVIRGRFALPPKEPGQGERIIVEALKKKKKFGKSRLESFNLTTRTPAGARDVARLQLTTN